MTETRAAPHLPYQPQIDGLRAIAVAAVVLYHFSMPGLGGGFTGVDVFFVISGYLIGGLLWTEVQQTGRIALGRFYMRRVRRLAPAFFAMLAATCAVSWFVLLPFEFRELGKQAIAATVWLSNVLFYQGTGYFDPGTGAKVLLHTWSLSVEEQFYLVLPLALIVLARRPSLTVPVLVVLWALSLAACIKLTAVNFSAAFFLFPFRAWEMLTGVLLAILWRGRRAGAPVSLAGLILVLGGIVLIPAGEGFPGALALIPVAGAALILAGLGSDNPVNRLLALPPMVGLGLISYSLYLWHWPVLILSGHWRGGAGGPLETALWLALALALSVASWAWIERPFRRPAVPGPAVLAGSVVAGIAALGFGLYAWRSDGAPGRFAPEVQLHIAASAGFLQDWSRCSRPADGPFAGVETCAIGPEGPAQVIIWGDSHLRALMDGLALAATEQATPSLIIWHAGCPPLFGLTKQESAATPAQDAACTAANAVMQAALTGPAAPPRLLIVGRWNYYAQGAGIGRDAHNTITLGAAPPLTAAPQADLYAAAWDHTLATLAPHVPQIFVLRQVPELPGYDSRQVAAALAHGRMTHDQAQALMTLDPASAAPRIMAAEAPLTAAAAAGRVTLLDPWPLICKPICTARQDGAIWYHDNNHLTNQGAIALRQLFAPVLAPLTALAPAPATSDTTP
jgi:peptidoglycan/LPS O-acetylase OafA/YrhL